MKNKIKKLILPIALLVIAVVGAFANKPSYQEDAILEKKNRIYEGRW